MSLEAFKIICSSIDVAWLLSPYLFLGGERMRNKKDLWLTPSHCWLTWICLTEPRPSASRFRCAENNLNSFRSSSDNEWQNRTWRKGKENKFINCNWKSGHAWMNKTFKEKSEKFQWVPKNGLAIKIVLIFSSSWVSDMWRSFCYKFDTTEMNLSPFPNIIKFPLMFHHIYVTWKSDWFLEAVLKAIKVLYEDVDLLLLNCEQKNFSISETAKHKLEICMCRKCSSYLIVVGW